MKKNAAFGLVILGVVIVVAVVQWRLYVAGPTKVGQVEPMTTSQPAVTPPLAAPQAKPSGSPGISVAPPFKTEPPQGIAPLLEPGPPASKIVVPPPPEMKEHYGILMGSYQNYKDAAKMLADLKKQGKHGFSQRDPKNPNLFQVWLGPFTSQAKARAAEKEMHARLKKSFKIEQIENPVPK